jgi:glycosyltransferase involved in cell wall biosynthesis
MVEGKKILIITYGNFPYGDASANLLRNFAFALDKEGNRVEVILPNGEMNQSLNRQNSSDNKRVYKMGQVIYRYLGYRSHPKNMMGKFFSLILGLTTPFLFLMRNSNKKEIDLVILYDINFTSALPLLLFHLIKKKKIIIILPEFYDHYQYPQLSKGRLNWYDFYLGIRFLSKHFDGFIVLTYFLKNYLLNKLQCDKPIFLMPNLVDPKDFYSDNHQSFIQNSITIGYVGTPSIKDGVMDLIEAFGLIFPKYQNIHLLIIGDLPSGNSLLPPLKNLAKKLGIKSSITFTGLVSRIKVSELLNSCQILALTRPNSIVSEAGFPTKLGEYFSCKKPVLLTSVGDMKIYFKDDFHVKFATPEDIKSIASGLEQLIQNENLRSVLADNCYKWMQENLSYHSRSKYLNDFIDNVLSK